jgi:hypothetical protein
LSKPLSFVNVPIDSKVYIDALKARFFQETHRAFGLRPWVVIQDWTSCHSSDEPIEELTKHCLLCPFWPENFPNENPIRTLLAIVKSGLDWIKFKNRNEAITEIRRVWTDIAMRVVNELCGFFASSLTMATEA